MRLIFLDFETYYDQDYSLRNMTPVEYVLDPRFECIGCSIQEGLTGTPFWLDGDKFKAWLDTLDPNDVMMVSHNFLFDGCILAWRYNFIPRIMSDTLAIARACFSHHLMSLSLAKVAAYLGIGFKTDVIIQVKGMSLAAIKAAGLYDKFVEYAINDVRLCVGIWLKTVVAGLFPLDELAILDMVIRCCMQPRFILDQTRLAEHLFEIQQAKELLLARAMLVGAEGKSALMSNDRFAELLQEVGVDPPTKVSAATGKITWAFAKSDPGFMALEEHPDEAVQVLIAARLGHKSTLDETRATRLLAIARLTWPDTYNPRQGLLPIPLRLSGAHTHRLSGDWSLNFQNLPTRKGNKLRQALRTREGEVVVASDSAQIQARLVAEICGQRDLVQQFAEGVDVYAAFASTVFGKPVTKADYPTERFVGKTCILGLGFGLGWQKFQRQLALDSKSQTGTEIMLDDNEATRIVNLYRGMYPNIPATWKGLNYQGIPALAFGGGYQYSLGPIEFEKGALFLPGHLKMYYHELNQKDTEWWYMHGGRPRKTYGGSLLENIVQYLERIIIMDAALRIQKRAAKLDIWLNLQSHDELCWIVKKECVSVMKDLAKFEMERRPIWMPRLPLLAEVKSGNSYADVK